MVSVQRLLLSKGALAQPLTLFGTAIRTASTAVGAQQRKRVVILGTGWGGFSLLQDIDRNKYDITVISSRNHFLITPLLPSTCFGTLEFRSVMEPVRNANFRASDYFHLARAIGLDLKKKTVTIKNVIDPTLVSDIPYDKLIIGVGCRTRTFGVPGVQENAFFLKEAKDAVRVRRRLLNNIELAADPAVSDEEASRLLHVVIVGGGATGSTFGAELYDFVKQDVKRLYKQRNEKVRVTLVESNKLLASFDSQLRKLAEKKIEKRSGYTFKQASVTEVSPGQVKLNTGETLDCGIVAWVTGIAPVPFTESLDVPKNKNGQILTDQYLRIKADESGSVYAIGDCADIDSMPLPTTAPVAEYQAKYLAKVLNNPEVQDPLPFRFRSKTQLAYLGGREGLTDTPDMKFSGFYAWLLWRYTYLSRLTSWRLRIQVPIDLLKATFLGRDVSNIWPEDKA